MVHRRDRLDRHPRHPAAAPDLELVGVWVHSAEKVGRDAGELAGGDPIGVAATDDVDALLAQRPDCIVYAASGPEQDAAAVPDYVRFLEAGVNVVTVSSWGLIHPPSYEPTWRGQLEDAAAVAARRCTPRASSPASPPTSSTAPHDAVELDPVDPGVGVRALRHLSRRVHDEGGHGVRAVARPRGRCWRYRARSSRRGVPSSGSSPMRCVEVEEIREQVDRVRPIAPSRSRAAPSRPAPAGRSARRPSAS